MIMARASSPSAPVMPSTNTRSSANDATIIAQSNTYSAQRSHLGVTHAHTRSTALSGTTQVSRYQKSKTNVDYTEARDSEWQRHQLGRMQVCTSLQTDNHASTPPLGKVFLYSLPSVGPGADTGAQAVSPQVT